MTDTRYPFYWSLTCSGCGYQTHDEANMRKHRKKVKRCKDANVVRSKMYATTWVTSLEAVEAIRASGAPFGLLEAPVPQVPVPPRTLTAEDLLKPEVVALESEEETEAVKEFLQERFVSVMHAPGVRQVHLGAVVRLFEATKLAADVPPALRNMAVMGNDVYYKADDGEVARLSKGKMVKKLLGVLINHLWVLIEDSDSEASRRLERLDNALYRPFPSSAMTIHEAMEAYATSDREQFKAGGQGLINFVVNERDRVWEAMARLPRFSCRGT